MFKFVTIQSMDDVAFAAVILGMGLLIGSLFVAGTGLLSVPGLLLVLPGLVYGLR